MTSSEVVDKITKAMQSSAPITTARVEMPPAHGHVWALMLQPKRRAGGVLATLVAHQQHQAEDRNLDQQNQPVARASQLVYPTGDSQSMHDPSHDKGHDTQAAPPVRTGG